MLRIVGSMSTTPMTSPIAAWTNPGTAFDARGFGSVDIWCWVAPTNPATINCGDGTNMLPQAIADTNGTGITVPTTISSPGRYSVDGGCLINLTNYAGGSFSISARNS